MEIRKGHLWFGELVAIWLVSRMISLILASEINVDALASSGRDGA